MADALRSSPNYAHPDYVTPEQLKNARAYADALMKRSGEGATRPAGAAAAMIDALTGVLVRNRADEQQSEAASWNAGRNAQLFDEMQSGRPIDTQNLANIYADPMASPETRATIGILMHPQPTKDMFNRPAFQSPMQGVQAAPVKGDLQFGLQTPVTVPGASTTVPVPAPSQQRAPVASSPRWYGDREAEAAGLYPSPARTGGGNSGPVSSPTPAAGPLDYLDPIFKKGQDFERQAAYNKAGAGAGGDVIKEDIAAANDAANVIKNVSIVEDDLRRYGDKITFGPTAEVSLKAKQAAANYFPGMMKEQAAYIAAAENINKIGVTLAGALAKQVGGGTQGEFYTAMQAVPGLTTTPQGALAMASMMKQAAAKQQQLGLLLQNPDNWGNYQYLKQQFYSQPQNQIINPLTNNPIQMDLTPKKGAAGSSGGARIISVEPAR